ncbi:hypothetical protein N836_18540 [Leptolyngbya sp. Heron Island J]|uniref:hypothetical protein n=1 Tax=Leptolyngbya sp. Heron Island J TaxID=1385935 RepID=UPI0003B99CD3|nr:hypothetical protein [Leptolyngbya sp. Heron Island J]ESA34130.1 hypothetical protein N836_18540 [Leptolyngbya sp. Heron Island J]
MKNLISRNKWLAGNFLFLSTFLFTLMCFQTPTLAVDEKDIQSINQDIEEVNKRLDSLVTKTSDGLFENFKSNSSFIITLFTAFAAYSLIKTWILDEREKQKILEKLGDENKKRIGDEIQKAETKIAKAFEEKLIGIRNNLIEVYQHLGYLEYQSINLSIDHHAKSTLTLESTAEETFNESMYQYPYLIERRFRAMKILKEIALRKSLSGEVGVNSQEIDGLKELVIGQLNEINTLLERLNNLGKNDVPEILLPQIDERHKLKESLDELASIFSIEDDDEIKKVKKNLVKAVD